jgi:geranylgeranyl diphosphate synthase type II
MLMHSAHVRNPEDTVDPSTPDEALRRLLDDGQRRADAVGAEHARLWRSLVEATEGGKRFRPALVTAAHEALHGTDHDAAAVVGAAVELLHTAFVIHDDVIDGDDVRRGRLNVSGVFTEVAHAAGAAGADAGHFGRTAAILAGDLAIAGAIRAVATSPAATPTIHRLLDLFDHALHCTAAGELSDVRLALGVSSASLTEVLTMEEQKTSAYSFALPLQAGAILAGAGDDVVERLGEAGRMIGIAFQLADDVLGMFGDPAVTGKTAIGDLREGKQTPLLTHARTTPSWDLIAPHVGRRDVTEEDAAEVRNLVVEAGSRRFVEELASDYVAAALRTLDELGLPATFLAAVSTLTADVSRRAA